MPLQLLKYNAGIVKDTTEYSAGKNGPFYVDSDLVRFVNGYAEKIGGWEKDRFFFLNPAGSAISTEGYLTGIGRKMLSWRGVDGVDRIVIGTHNHLYIIQNNAIYDITPLRKTTSNLSNPLVTTSGSKIVTVTDSNHGANTSDWVVINSAAATGGVTADTLNNLNGFQITRIDANSYTIEVPSAATGNATGGGTTIDIKYLIGLSGGLGTQSSNPALGWGVGGWGEAGWNMPRSLALSQVNLENSSWTNPWDNFLEAAHSFPELFDMAVGLSQKYMDIVIKYFDGDISLKTLWKFWVGGILVRDWSEREWYIRFSIQIK